MDYLAVAQMPSRWTRTPIQILMRRAYRPPRAWHAVTRDKTEPVALCGYRYVRELHRTWNQTTMGRRCRRCEGLIAEAERRHLLRGPLWASPWSPEDAPEKANVAPSGRDTSPDRSSDYGYGYGDSYSQAGSNGNGANSETGHGVAATTVNGAGAHSEHDAGSAAQTAEPAGAAQTPWTGRPIRRNGVLPSDVVRL